ncbi:type VI secretion system-associated FHA domain protein TagH [Pokkaliibacter sp. MBI-7]|uniref:type VI secretion system-associated FHA domain protein TagH n=1 Tax=Pokkaliibacter sp. MBI-7 TaxID=3040600 RepID=UPI0024476237|nr:type VI secretion system-associated FHA domain protein TagH [Pokkaliibacter sp. MBI-7]MDH2432935.1 type VI secretion system-associated FHA domain protein TagH [Pokkaliibacter sp. MBI-7]
MDMELELSVISYHRLSPGQESVRVFDHRGGTLGRSEQCDWCLPDPERVLSGTHARVEMDAEGFVVTDLSTNGLFINRRVEALGKGNRHRLNSNDVLCLGDYEIRAQLRPRSAPATPPLQQPQPLMQTAEMSAASVAAQSVPSPEASVSQPVAAAAPVPAHSMQRSMSQLGLNDHFPLPQGTIPAASQRIEPVVTIPEDWDQEWLGGPHEPLEPNAEVSSRFDAFLTDAPVAEPVAAQSEEAPQPVATGAHSVAAVQAAAAPSQVITTADSAMLAQTQLTEVQVVTQTAMTSAIAPSSSPAVVVPPVAPAYAAPVPVAVPSPQQNALRMPEPAHAAPTVLTEPAVMEAEPQSLPTPTSPAVAAMEGNEQQALRAYLRGLGIHPDMAPANHDPEWWLRLGEASRQLLEGLIVALRERSRFKSEFRVNHTQFRTTENNPLKFSAGVEDAVHNLFNRRSNSFMPADKAIADAFADIASHEQALLRGVEGAVAGLLRQMDPQQISQRQFREGMLDKLNPARRQASYWQLYAELHQTLSDDVRSQQQCYLDDFIQAYEAADHSLRGTH